MSTLISEGTTIIIADQYCWDTLYLQSSHFDSFQQFSHKQIILLQTLPQDEEDLRRREFVDSLRCRGLWFCRKMSLSNLIHLLTASTSHLAPQRGKNSTSVLTKVSRDKPLVQSVVQQFSIRDTAFQNGAYSLSPVREQHGN